MKWALINNMKVGYMLCKCVTGASAWTSLRKLSAAWEMPGSSAASLLV